MRNTLLVTTALALCALAAIPSPAPAAPGDLTIASSGFGVTVLGPMRPRADATRTTAIRLFGTQYRRGTQCRFTWPAIGLTLQMANFGGGTDPCRYAQFVTIAGPSSGRWRTARGLRVGSSVATLRRLYPQSVARGSAWTLTAARSPYSNRTERVIWALVSNGKVTALRGWVGGAGD